MRFNLQLTTAALLTSLAAFSTSVALADCMTDSLTINAKVPQSCEINVVATDLSKHILDISKASSGVLVGYANEKCNDANGYTVSMVASNSGDFTGLFVDSISKAKHPFAVSYNGELVRKNTVTDSDVPAMEFVQKPIVIAWADNADLPSSDAYTYTETLKFTICAK